MLELRHMHKQYTKTGQAVLRDIDLTIRQGEFVAVLGSSGAGKSTLIRCINQLVLPSSGEVLWEGKHVQAKSRADMRRHRQQIGMIFQGFHLLERADVLTNVLVGRFGDMSVLRAIAGRFQREEINAAEQVLQRVGMLEFRHARVRDLSGGQKQRVAIARALVQRPKLILGDEPVSNLDPVTAEGIMKLLQELCREQGITMLLNLHSVELAKAFASRIIGLAHGRIVFDGGPAELDAAVLQSIYSAR
ncbi:phosphonate ABC transporter ATP-binding protein [Ectobacillus ponti]|uniref:Phosphonate ABC transporter ATP-binding protein n=1 Tax=Ectobacillus ponti TaxID=2961894 RepID=A0AA41X1S1_9BACI|nr:phosphonate ABC transporter ATP-binding protein [Ectobacillus ponti]MCP8967356.1 phosphonate ABC transporter ATP-binding protein [Ectobacillus ponti]